MKCLLAHCATVAALSYTCVAFAQHGAVGGEWREYSGDPGATKYSPLEQINRSNAAQLRIEWRRPALDAAVIAAAPQVRAGGNFHSTPLMVGGVLFAPNAVGFVEAFDAGTGKTLWVEPPLDGSPTGYRGGTTRGVAYWRSGDDARILVQHSQHLLALDAQTGKPVATFGDAGRVNVSADIGGSFVYTWTGAPFVIGDVVVLGGTPGDEFANKEAMRSDVRAYDVRTGKLRWVFHVIPQAGEPGVETWENESWRYTGHSPVWSQMSGDPELGLVYLPVTAPTSDMYGGHRLGDNLFSQSVVAVEAATGKRVWHFQMVRHDLWDYDPPAAPILMDIQVDTRRIKALVQLTKQGFAYALDRTNGKPVWPIVERAVPASNVPGERTAPTQPIPTKPPAYESQGAVEDNLIDFTPELRAEALEILKRYTYGPLFTPPTLRDERPGGKLGTIQLPGSIGGANWTGGAVDPDTGILYVPSATAPLVADLEAGDPAVTNLRYVKGFRSWGPAGPRGLPLFKPPYGRITALDMNSGEIRWQVANGDGPRDNPAIAHLHLPPLGNPGLAAPLVTKTLLFAGEGSDAMVNAARVPPDMPIEEAAKYGKPWFRAYDKATGAVVAEIAVPAGTTGAPMTYMHGGKQYIVVAVGGRKAPAEWIALGVPDSAEPKLDTSKPNIFGVWLGTGPENDPRYRSTPWPVPEFTEWGAAQSKLLMSPATPDECSPYGPVVYMSGTGFFPIEIARTTAGLIVLLESAANPRRIYTDGRKHPQELDPTWAGHAVGRWEGETLVVDTIGTNGRGRPLNGYIANAVNSKVDTTPRLLVSDRLHLVERIRLVGGGEYLEDELTIDDPKTYQRPFKVKHYWQRRPDLDPLEYFCSDNRRPDAEGHTGSVE